MSTHSHPHDHIVKSYDEEQQRLLQELLRMGVHTALAVSLFQSGELTSARAAKLARMGLAEFLAHLSEQGIPVVDHDPAELEQELAAFDAAR